MWVNEIHNYALYCMVDEYWKKDYKFSHDNSKYKHSLLLLTMYLFLWHSLGGWF